MKKFLYRVIIFFVSLVIILIILPFQFNHWVFNHELESKMEYFLKDADSLDFIITGESRARDNISPNVIKEEFNWKTVNVAVNNCDLNTIYNALNKYELLNNGYTFLVSASFFVQIDLGTRDPRRMSTASILNMPFFDQLDFFGTNYAFVFQNILKGFFNDLAFKLNLTNFTIDKSSKEHKGFVPQSGVATDSLIQYQLHNNPYFKRSNYDKKYNLIKKVITNLSKTNSKIVLFQPPIIPEFHRQLKDQIPDLVEIDYAEMLKNEADKYDNIYFMDFYNDPVSELTNKNFHDIVHLTEEGAIIFSRKLVDRLINKGLLKNP